MYRNLLLFILMTTIAYSAYAKPEQRALRDYRGVIQKTAAMVYDPETQELVRKYGLQILDLTWEDTGRYKNSAVGPNISDMTIQIQHMDPGTRGYALICMPVIRYPNFSDRTADLSLDKFYLLAGNERGEELKKVTLREFLENMRSYLNDPDSWKGSRSSLLEPRDTHLLVSAQACFLPIPKQGKAEFNPVLFNYQSYEKDPAVLTILATREGTSVTVIDNKRDGFQAGYSWGQRLFFNQNGERASLTGERISDFRAEGQQGENPSGESGEKEGLNMVFLIQVPLKQKNPMRYEYGLVDTSLPMECSSQEKKAGRSDIEDAVIGHGKVEGPFTEIDSLAIRRDPAFPIRVTVQFYKATSNGVITENDIREIAEQIERVYEEADYVGSLVVGGDTGRPTEYIGDKTEPADWWEKFWKRHEENTGQTKDEADSMFKHLFGWDYNAGNRKD